MTRQSRKHEQNFSVAESGTEIPKNWLRKSVKIDLSQIDQYYKTMTETQKKFKVVKNTLFSRPATLLKLSGQSKFFFLNG